MCYSTHVVPFRVELKAGSPLFEQVVYAATKAIVSGRMRPGDAFPSVRTLSKDVKINPNTAAKVIAHLIATGLIESMPGIGTVVVAVPESSRKQKTTWLANEIEALVVEAKRLGIGCDELTGSVHEHWDRLSDQATKDRAVTTPSKRRE